MSLLAQSQQWYPTHVKVVVIRARGLRTKGKDGTNDAYAIMQLGKEQYSSSVAEKTTAPQWREEAEFEMPPLQPGRADKSTLRLTVMHRALVGLDKFLGQAAISLSELYAKKTRSKVGWYRLHSKTGKVDKERGEIEADIQFVRNNMTASMFDLSAKDKSRSALGKLKDRLKGKKRDGFSDSASAIVPSLGAVGDSDEEDEEAARAATTSRLRKLLPKSTLQRTSLSQSMSVIPTAPSSPPGNASPGGFTEIRLDDSAGEESSGKGLQVPTIVSHKRAASTDNTQLDLALPGNPRKEPLSLFGGLRPKSDPVSQSNLCINGSHVYTEEPSQAVPSKPRPEPRSRFYAPSPEEDPRPETPPRATADTPGPASAERGVGSPDPGVGRAGPAPEERVQSLNPFEANEEEEEQVGSGEAMPEEPRPQAKKEEAGRGGLMSLFPKKTEAPKALEGKELRRTSEEGRGEVKKPASTSVWANRMAAIKPKPHPVKPMTAAEPKIHDVSSEENLKARLKVVDTVVTRPATGQAVTFGERLTSPKDCDPSDPAAAYSLLTHDELIQLVLKQKEIISKKDCHVQELENYIDNLLVRVMEETPNILRVSYQPPRKAERV